jgi:hypothetical protein
MPFALNGTRIDQTGTDTDLSGLSGIAGVTTEQTSTGAGTHTTYNVGTLSLQIDGTLTINPEVETLYTSVVPPNNNSTGAILLNGTLTIGEKKTQGGKTKYASGTAIYHTGNGNSNFSRPCIRVSGGTLDWFGGFLYTPSVSLIVNTGSIINLESGGIFNLATTSRQFRLDNQNATDDSNFNLSNFILDGVGNISFFTLSGFNTFSPVLLNASFQNFTSSQPDQLFVNWNNESNFASADYLGNSTNSNPSLAVYRNTVNDAIITSNVSNRDGLLTQERAVSISPKNPDGTAITNFVYYSVDTDNGSRFVSFNGRDFTPDQVFQGLESADTLSLNIRYRIGQVFNEVVTYDDRRDPNGTIPVSLFKYAKNISVVNPTLLGLNTFEAEPFLLNDLSITEPDKAVVDAYPISIAFDGTTYTVTGDSATVQTITAAQLYDAIASYMEDNFEGEDLRLSRVLDTIDGTALDVNITLDYIALQGSVTLNATRTLTLNNGSTVSGGIIDSNGDSFLSFMGIDAWSVYANQTDANLDQNVLGSGLGTEIYRFTFAPATPYFLRLTVEGDTLFKILTPTESGETEVSLSQAALLTGIQASTATIDKKLGFVPAVIFCDTTLAAAGDGTSAAPFNTFDAAVGLARDNNTRSIRILASSPAQPAIALQDCSGLQIQSHAGVNALVFNGQNFAGAEISRITVTGAMTGADVTLFECGMSNATGLFGLFAGCKFLADCSFAGASLLDDCVGASASAMPVTLTLDAGVQAALTGWEGRMTLAGVTAGETTINGDGLVTLAASCTGGEVILFGDIDVTDLSNGSVVTDLTTYAGLDALATQASLDALNNFDPATDQVIVATNNDKLDYELANNAITSNKVATGALNNASFTTGYFNSINAEVDEALADYDGPTKAELDAAVAGIPAAPSAADVYAEFTTGSNEDVFKADVSGLATQASITALNDFDPANDVVARVTLVDTTTANTDMRGTDAALLASNYTAPDNAGITANGNAIAALPTPLTAAEVNAEVDTALADYDAPTKAELDAAQASIEADIAAIPATDLSSLETKVEADARQALLIAEHDQTQTDISSLPTSSAPSAADIYAEFTSGSNEDVFKADVSLLALESTVNALNNLSSSDITAAVPTTAEIEAALLNEGDGQQLIDAIVQAIDNSNVNEVALVAAIRSDLERAGGSIATIDGIVDAIKAKTDTLVNTDLSALETKAQADVRQTSLITEINANETKIDTLTTDVAAIPTTDSVADLAPVLTAISGLNDIDTAAIRAELTAELARLDVAVSSVAYDDTALTTLVNALPTLTEMEGSTLLTAVADLTGLSTHDAAEVVTALQAVASDFKADVSALATQASITSLNDFDPASDVVARVTLVDTTTVNTDMRGTDTALLTSSYTAPDNAGIAAILVDTDELQSNQGDWETATGFATLADITSAQASITSEINANETKIDLLETKSQADSRQSSLIAALTGNEDKIDLIETKAQADTRQLALLSEFNDLPTAADVYAEFTSGTNEDAFKADISALATAASISALNDFDPANDVVARVTLVDTTTTNTDMRGTDNALLASSYTAPDNAGITANGNAIAALPVPLTAAEVNAEVDSALADYDAPTKAELDAAASRIESRQEVINKGVQNASLIIPHTDDLV